MTKVITFFLVELEASSFIPKKSLDIELTLFTQNIDEKYRSRVRFLFIWFYHVLISN